MNSAKKVNHGKSLSLLFISFCSGFTSFHYQAVCSQYLFAHHGFRTYNFQISLVAFLLSCPLGYLMAKRVLFSIGNHSLLLMITIFEIFFITFAVFSKNIMCSGAVSAILLPLLRLFEASLLYIISLALLPLLMSTSIALLSRIFEDADASTPKTLYLWFITGSVTSLFFSQVLRLNLMGLENSLYLCAFLNFSCILILLIHYSFTQNRNQTGR
ncbi:hypothetical protein [Emticicia sp. TH156]|uniref:hypothetical protein n=1 Tax=Emticicia sp. TH156 TaxID=2067454 RepID=UPI000C76F1FC|nr:hypothetical protein [Emticicia sp. TH156]PLK44425.1 hypothetical protein C0V77_11620 [Emticicia sp. TH156]